MPISRANSPMRLSGIKQQIKPELTKLPPSQSGSIIASECSPFAIIHWAQSKELLISDTETPLYARFVTPTRILSSLSHGGKTSHWMGLWPCLLLEDWLHFRCLNHFEDTIDRTVPHHCWYFSGMGVAVLRWWADFGHTIRIFETNVCYVFGSPDHLYSCNDLPFLANPT